MNQKEFKDIIETYKEAELVKLDNKYSKEDYDFLLSKKSFLCNCFFNIAKYTINNFPFEELNSSLKKEIELNSIYLPLFHSLKEKGLDPLTKQFSLSMIDPFEKCEDNTTEIQDNLDLLDLIEEFKSIKKDFDSGEDQYGLEYNRFILIVKEQNSRGNYFIIPGQKFGSTFKISNEEAIKLYELNSILSFKNTFSFNEALILNNIKNYEKSLQKAKQELDIYTSLLEAEKEELIKLREN